jgi:hypothetical protein
VSDPDRVLVGRDHLGSVIDALMTLWLAADGAEFTALDLPFDAFDEALALDERYHATQRDLDAAISALREALPAKALDLALNVEAAANANAVATARVAFGLIHLGR